MERKQKAVRSTSSPPSPPPQKQAQSPKARSSIKKAPGGAKRNVKFAQPISRLKIFERPSQPITSVTSRELTKKDLPPVLSLVLGMEMAAKQFNLRPNRVSKTGPEASAIHPKPVATTNKPVQPKAAPRQNQPLAAGKNVAPAGPVEDDDEAFGPVMSPARSGSFSGISNTKTSSQQNLPTPGKKT